MTDAPERIWASHPGVGWDAIGGAWHHIRDAHDPPQVLYRRADLPPTLAEAMTVPEVKALVNCVAKGPILGQHMRHWIEEMMQQANTLRAASEKETPHDRP